MQYLFNSEGEVALRALTRQPSLYAFDFDGTLAPIVTRPTQAAMLPAVAWRLERLAAQVPVALVSGRSRDDLAARVPASVPWLIGNHGNEGGAAPDPAALVADQEAAARVVAAWRTQLKAQPALQEALGQGGELEDKGLSITLHSRRMRDPEAGERRFAALAAALAPPPQLIGGKRVLNLLPPGARTKFEAVAALAQAQRACGVLYVGDDVTDEHVFERAPAHWVTVRVERARYSRARFFVHQQASVSMLLDLLLRELARAAPIAGGAG